MKPQMQFMSKVFRIWSLNLTPEISELESLWFCRPTSGMSHPPQPDSGYSNADSANDKGCVAGGERRRKDGGTQTASQEDEASLIANASPQMLIAQSSGWVVLQDENGTTGKNSKNEQFLRRRFFSGVCG